MESLIVVPQTRPYEPIDSAEVLIIEFLESMKNTANDTVFQDYYEKFRTLTLYGTREQPLFVAAQIGAIMGINKIQTTIRNCEEGIEILHGEIQLDGRVQKAVLLTEHGITSVMFRTKSPLAPTFRLFIYSILSNLKLHRKVELDTALSGFRAKYDAVLDQNKELKLRLQQNTVAKRQMDDFHRLMSGTELVEMFPQESLMYRYLLETKAVSVMIYAVDPESLRKARVAKKKGAFVDDCSSDEDEAAPTFAVDDLNYSLLELHEAPSEEFEHEPLALFVPPFKTTKVYDSAKFVPMGEIYFADKEHYAEWLAGLAADSQVATRRKNCFAISLADMRAVAEQCIGARWQALQRSKFRYMSD